MKIIIIGDTHGLFNYVNVVIKQEKPDLIISCGDFGYFPNLPEYAKRELMIDTSHTTILFCDGNHEDHWALRELKDRMIAPNIFYQPRGSTYRLPDGRNILFMGGANSIDKDRRIPGVSWWPEETISQNDFQNLPEEGIDIFVTHTCSNEIFDSHIKKALNWGGKDVDPSYDALSALWEMYQPAQWFFGHFHINMSGLFGSTRWHCLSAPRHGSGAWWMKLTD